MAMTDGDTAIFVDTNVLIRFTIASAPLHEDAQSTINALWNRGVDIWISRQVLREYAAVLTRPQTYVTPLSPLAVAAELRAFQSQFHIADETAAVTQRLLVLLESVPLGGKQVHDANVVATMQAYSIPRLLTLNTSDFVRFSAYITVLSLEDVAEDSGE